MTVADRIKNKRLELNMTQKELSDKIGTKDRSSISKIETKGDDISMKDIVRISEALNVTPQYLLGWEDESPAVVKVYKKVGSKKVEASPEDMERALDFYRKYKDAIPEIQAAVLALLKTDQQDS